MTISYDDALAQPGPLLAGWSLPDDDFYTLSIFSLQGGGARQIAVRRVPVADKVKLSAELETRGLRIGEYDVGNEHVWSTSGGHFTAWSSSQRVVDAHGGLLALADGKSIPVASVAAVVSYADPSMVERGVRLELTDGGKAPVAVEYSAVAEADSSYTRNELLFESTWASLLGRKLAAAIGAKFRDEI